MSYWIAKQEKYECDSKFITTFYNFIFGLALILFLSFIRTEYLWTYLNINALKYALNRIEIIVPPNSVIYCNEWDNTIINPYLRKRYNLKSFNGENLLSLKQYLQIFVWVEPNLEIIRNNPNSYILLLKNRYNDYSKILNSLNIKNSYEINDFVLYELK